MGNISYTLSRVMLERCKLAEQKLAETVLSSTEPYVPYRTGRLMRSGHIEDNSASVKNIVYSAPYASECYYATHPFSKRRHALATARWFEAAKSVCLDEWTDVVKRELSPN